MAPLGPWWPLLLLAVLPPPFAAAAERGRPLRVLKFVTNHAADELLAAVAEEFEAATGLAVQYDTDTEALDAATRVSLAKQRMPAGDLDVAALDTIEILQLAESSLPLKDKGQFYPVVVESHKAESGELLALPLFVSYGMLYYRSDLLRKYGFKPPGEQGWTYEEMEEIAKVVQEGERSEGWSQFQGLVWSGRSYEGLSIVIQEVLAAHGVEELLGPNGTVRVNSEAAQKAMARLVSWTSGPGAISGLRVLTYDEMDVATVFCYQGGAMFARNWPFMLALCNSQGWSGSVAVAQLPGLARGGGRGIIGGLSMAVAKQSPYVAEAEEFVALVTSALWQRRIFETVGMLSARRDVTVFGELCRGQKRESCRAELSSIPGAWSVLSGRLSSDAAPPTIIVNASSGLCPNSTGRHAVVCDLFNEHLQNYLLSRPTVRAGANYERVSRALYESVHRLIQSAAALNSVFHANTGSGESPSSGLLELIRRHLEEIECGMLRSLGKAGRPDYCYEGCGNGFYVDKAREECEVCEAGRYARPLGLESVSIQSSLAGGNYSVLRTRQAHAMADGMMVRLNGGGMQARSAAVEVLSPQSLRVLGPDGEAWLLPLEEGLPSVRPIFECLPCMPGSHAPRPRSTSCTPCERGKFEARLGQVQCTDCPTGTYQPDAGQTACLECAGSFGWQSLSFFSEEGSSACGFQLLYFCKSAVCLLLAMAATRLLCKSLWMTIRLEDVCLQEGRLVVTSLGPHHLHVRRGAEVALSATGCPALDAPGQRFRAFRMDSVRLELQLVGANGQAVPKPFQPGTVDASKGRLVVRLTSSLRRSTSASVPALLWMAVVIGLEVGFTYSWQLRPESATLASFLGVLLAVAYSLVKAWRYWHCDSPLQRLVSEYRGRLLERNPRPRSCPRGPGRAVTAGQLADLQQHFSEFLRRKRNMYYLNTNISLPLTAPYALSFAELAGPKDADYFVSHYWGFPFNCSVDAVRRHAKTVTEPVDEWRQRAYWICVFSNNQWQLQDEVGNGDWRQSSFYKTLNCGHCRATCMILDEEAMPLTRSWCLFEVLQTFILQSQESSFGGLVLCTTSGVLNTGSVGYDVALAIARRLSMVKVEEARASVEDDKRMIDDLVRSYGGFPKMDDYVRGNIRAVLGTVRVHFEEDCSHLDTALGNTVQLDQGLADAIIVAHEGLRSGAVSGHLTLTTVTGSTEEAGPSMRAAITSLFSRRSKGSVSV